jgi:GH43 family beta-xylosidase
MRRLFAYRLFAYRLFVVSLVSFVGLIAFAQHAAAAGVPYDAPDPALILANGHKYVFTTNANFSNVPVWELRAGGEQVFVGDALPQLGAWATSGKTWAPDAAFYGGQWWLYYTATDTASGRQCIGAAHAGQVTGPYVDDRGAPLVCQVERGGSIDPSVTITADGVGFLYWKSDDNAIGQLTVLWAARLGARGDEVTSTPTQLAWSDQRWERGIVENPDMVLTSSGWMLFYSAGDWESVNYGTGYLTCAGPLGPCTKRTKKSALWTSDDNTVGQGGASVVALPNNRLAVAYHGWPKGSVGYANGGARHSKLAVVEVDNGRPRQVL